jgi:hypothetical protein
LEFSDSPKISISEYGDGKVRTTRFDVATKKPLMTEGTEFCQNPDEWRCRQQYSFNDTVAVIDGRKSRLIPIQLADKLEDQIMLGI